jgi:hypothetical protein
MAEQVPTKKLVIGVETEGALVVEGTGTGVMTVATVTVAMVSADNSSNDGGRQWQQKQTMTLWLCCSIVAALAYGRIRKINAMSAPHISCLFVGAWLC